MTDTQRLADIAAYLEETNPITASAADASYLVTNAQDDRKLEVFEQAFRDMQQRLAAWVKDGFRLHMELYKDPVEAERKLRLYLKRWLGCQTKSYRQNELPVMPANKTIAFWVAGPPQVKGANYCLSNR